MEETEGEEFDFGEVTSKEGITKEWTVAQAIPRKSNETGAIELLCGRAHRSR